MAEPTCRTVVEALERDARAVSGEEPYEVLWSVEVVDGKQVFTPHRRHDIEQENIWEDEGGHV